MKRVITGQIATAGLLLLLAVPLLSGCFRGGNSEGSTTTPSVVAVPPPAMGGNPTAKPVEGSAFNKLFPAADAGYKLVYTQEKKGFAQAELSKSGKKLATLSLSDTNANPEARTKYAQSSKKIGGYPATAVGSQGTAILVGDRYQVQVRSNDASFGESDREAWIEKFKLSDLARLGGK